MLSRKRVTVAAAFGVVIGLAIAGFALWQRASDGEKQAELGSSVLGGAVVGLSLLIAERLWARTTEEREGLIGLRASTEPTAGKQDQQEAVEVPEPDTEQPFAIVYEGQQRDTSRIDARQVRLRVFKSEEYFQFVAAVASGPDLVLLGAEKATSPGRFWRAFSEEAAPLIRDAVKRGEIPREDPTRAYEVFPGVQDAMKRAAANPDEVSEGQVVARFRA